MTEPTWYLEKREIGSATLYRGDALFVLPRLDQDGKRADALITDPPYSSGGMVRSDRTLGTSKKYQQTGVMIAHPEFSGDNRDQRSFGFWMSLWLSAAQRACNPGAICALFADWRQLPMTTDAIQAGGWIWRGIAAWNKVNARPVPGRFRAQCEFLAWGTNGPHAPDPKTAVYLPGAFECPPPGSGEREHTTQKPLRLMDEIVRICPTGTVLDPFMGSGTTGVAAVNAGLDFVGVELSEIYFERACERIAQAQAQQSLF